MSLEALNWAFRQEVKNSTAKFVLVAMANRATPNERGQVVAFTSLVYLAKVTAQDRKTVVSNLAKLRTWGLIEDTGNRVGKTRQVPVYELKCPPDLFTELAQNRNGSKIGTVPKTSPNSPVFPGKQAQKRDTDSALIPFPTQSRRPASGRGKDANRAGAEVSGKLPTAEEVLAPSRPKKPASPEAIARAVRAVKGPDHGQAASIHR